MRRPWDEKAKRHKEPIHHTPANDALTLVEHEAEKLLFETAVPEPETTTRVVMIVCGSETKARYYIDLAGRIHA